MAMNLHEKIDGDVIYELTLRSHWWKLSIVIKLIEMSAFKAFLTKLL